MREKRPFVVLLRVEQEGKLEKNMYFYFSKESVSQQEKAFKERETGQAGSVWGMSRTHSAHAEVHARQMSWPSMRSETGTDNMRRAFSIQAA